jgi:hypothetical protein
MHEFEKLVQGTDVAICDTCTTGLSRAIKDGAPLPVGSSIRDASDLLCGFCRNKSGHVTGVVVRNGAAICPECLRTCAEIITGP